MIQETQFKPALPELGVPLNPGHQFLNGLHGTKIQKAKPLYQPPQLPDIRSQQAITLVRQGIPPSQ